MTRVKRGSVAQKRHKKIIKLTKGFVGSHSKLFSTANQQNMKALKYAYNDRRKKKNQSKRLWIVRMNAMSRKQGKTYSGESYTTKLQKIILNKKIISEDNIRVYFEPIRRRFTLSDLISYYEGPNRRKLMMCNQNFLNGWSYDTIKSRFNVVKTKNQTKITPKTF